MTKPKEKTKLIVAMQEVDGELVQSPLCRKSFKTWAGAMGGFGFGAATTVLCEDEGVRTISVAHQIVFLVDVLGAASEAVRSAANASAARVIKS